MGKKDGAKKSTGGKGGKGDASFWSAKNAPVFIVCAVLVGGVLLAMTPAPSRTGRDPLGRDAGAGAGGQQKGQTLEDAVNAIHKARDLPEFTAEVLLSVMSRFYSVYLGGPIPAAVAAHAATDEGKGSQGWSAARPNAFKAFAFASDTPIPAKLKGRAQAEALQRQVITEAHIHMLARAGDRVYVDPNSGFGGGDVDERCKVLTGYGLRCFAWTDETEEAVNADLQQYEAKADGDDTTDGPAGAVFVVGSSQRLLALGVVNADPAAAEAKPISKVLHVLFSGPPQTQEQREKARKQQELKEQFEVKPDADAAAEPAAAAAAAADAAPTADA